MNAMRSVWSARMGWFSPVFISIASWIVLYLLHYINSTAVLFTVLTVLQWCSALYAVHYCNVQYSAQHRAVKYCTALNSTLYMSWLQKWNSQLLKTKAAILLITLIGTKQYFTPFHYFLITIQIAEKLAAEYAKLYRQNAEITLEVNITFHCLLISLPTYVSLYYFCFSVLLFFISQY